MLRIPFALATTSLLLPPITVGLPWWAFAVLFMLAAVEAWLFARFAGAVIRWIRDLFR